MTTHETTTTDSGPASTVARLQRDWILSWDKRPDERLGPFDEVLGAYYDVEAAVILFDDFDPQRRVFRTVHDYADAFWATFQNLRSARHAFEVEPEAIVSGDLAATRMVFIALLESEDGTVANRCVNSQVWRRTEELGWRISRDHTSVEAMDVDEARERYFPGGEADDRSL